MVDTTYSEYIGDGRPDGTIFGRTTSELIGFHGKTPTAIYSTTATTVTTAASTTITLAAGYATTTQADAIVTQLNTVITALINKGLLTSA